MSIFKKNPNEAAYVGGAKHWTDVIKNSGSADLLIWKQPEEDFNTNSTLIVMPGEEAIFVKGGVVEQVFENGTYKLSTENYPFISRLRNAFSGGISTFNCVVYFVRKAISKEINWGTASPIQVRDKVWGVRTEAKVRGAYQVQVDNAAVMLEKLVAGKTSLSQDELIDYIKNNFQGKIKAAVSKFLNALEQELIGIDAYLDELSEKITPYIDECLSEYGLKCATFSLSGLDIDKTKYDTLDEFQTSKKGLDILGNDWQRVQAMGVLKDMANNPGGVASAGAGLGMGFGAAGAFGTMAQGAFTSAPAATTEDPIEVLTKLKKMLDAGLIEKSEYDAKKAEILSRM